MKKKDISYLGSDCIIKKERRLKNKLIPNTILFIMDGP